MCRARATAVASIAAATAVASIAAAIAAAEQRSTRGVLLVMQRQRAGSGL